MMRVSTTHIDQYRYYKQSEDMSLDALLERLTPTAKPTEAMKIGTAFHTILETLEGELSAVEQDGYTFNFALDADIALPDIKEIKATKDYDGITVVGKVDAVSGGVIDDHKTASQFNPDSYFDSVQWKIYLDIFQAEKFRYNVFTRYVDKQGIINIRALDIFPLYRYPDLEDDVERIVAEYAEFAERYGVYSHRDAA